MGNLVLNSLELSKFRGFQHLLIERLGRVNLIVGKNNVGKSNLLEALQMYGHRASTSTIISEIMETSQPSKEITCVLVPANGDVGLVALLLPDQHFRLHRLKRAETTIQTLAG